MGGRRIAEWPPPTRAVHRPPIVSATATATATTAATTTTTTTTATAIICIVCN